MEFLDIDNLRKEFGETVAVDGISFSVEEGEFVTVVGPSGCGKTTTLLNIAGLQTPTSGSIRLQGTDLTDLPPYERDIGVVFQDYALFPHKTVGENIAFGLKMRGADEREREAKVSEMLSMINLEGYENEYPHECSGGQQQRVAVARALAFDPDLVLMDEPLSNLDKKLRGEMRTELKRIQRETGITTIYVTHNQTEALSMGDRIAVLNDGTLEQYDDPKTAYERPASPFVADFLGTSSRIDGTLRLGSTPDVRFGDSTMTVEARDGIDDGDDVAVFVRTELASLSTERPAVENAFRGTIESVDYQGQGAVYFVSVPAFETTVQVNHHANASMLEPGNEVWVSIDPSDVIYTASGASADSSERPEIPAEGR
ncbi:ABC transporter ATP-binding protein [Natrinema sp. 1APR25-10V2]|uniref:ABC transporter ATP-binding protein n=1 Tax=Natrinema sp. 1APR25-10V2 TaxID=2951081 RepID=UPI00287704CD|nr:ABC transporter ATP-binding protein [Natrinema sp. 1APR25-10V2]MDS0474866.1 ABC transporter ATP-binding protein [Natrinema sp. 1APR25-10V2]